MAYHASHETVRLTRNQVRKSKICQGLLVKKNHIFHVADMEIKAQAGKDANSMPKRLLWVGVQSNSHFIIPVIAVKGESSDMPRGAGGSSSTRLVKWSSSSICKVLRS